MATPLDPRTLKVGQEYHRESIPSLAGLDLDSNTSTISKGRFTDLRNFRIESEGELTLRTGIKEYDITRAWNPESGFVPMPAGSVPVATCEYVVEYVTSGAMKTLRYNVLLWWDGATGAVALSIVDKAAETSWTATLSSTITAGDTTTTPPTPPTVGVCQLNTSLIVSVYDVATYSLEPTSVLTPITSGTTWNVTTLGKDLTPVPLTVSFVGKTTGDLLVFNNDDHLYDSHGASGGQLHVFSSIPDPITGDPQVLKVPIDAPYFLATGPEYSSIVPQTPWVKGAGDPAVPEDAASAHFYNHTKSRAWGYRFVAVRTSVDAKGNTVYRNSKPSADLWVEDRMYIPPIAGRLVSGVLTFPDQIANPNTNPQIWFDLSDLSSWDPDNSGPGIWQIGNGDGTFTTVHTGTTGQTLFPSKDDFFDLQAKFRSLSTSSAPLATQTPYYATARYLGWGDPAVMKFPGDVTPYKLMCPASEFKGAPLTMFDATTFPIDWSTTEEILIFRTAHSEPDDSKNVTDDPLFEPHTYGYIGSLKQGQVFTDDIPDTGIDFGNTPDQYDGYEVGQFSAQRVRDYQTKLVLGNTKTTYWVDTPGPAVSAMYLDGKVYNGISPSSHLTPSTDFAPSTGPGDGLNTISFHFAYVDGQGNQSDLSDITLNNAAIAHDSDEADWMFFVLPRGMTPDIVTLRLYVSRYSGGVRKYFKLGDYPVTDPVIAVSSDSVPAYSDPSGITPRPTKTVKNYYEPPQYIYSLPNAPTEWPPLQVERAHPFAPITGMEVILGELWVFTTDSATLTILQASKPRVEEETRQIGAISRTAIQKWNKVVFFLSASGLYFAEGSGVVPFPAQIQTAVRKYLDEYIPGLGRHANAKRASLGMLAHRYELWLYFPSSVDLWASASGVAPWSSTTAYVAGNLVSSGGVTWKALQGNTNVTPANDGVNWVSCGLPQSLYIYKFLTGEVRRHYLSGEVLGVENYQFDLSPSFALVNNTSNRLDPSKFRSDQVFFASHGDGTLYASYADTTATQIATINCDYPATWTGSAIAEMPFALTLPQSPKLLRTLYVKASANAALTFITGMAKTDGSYDAVRGHIIDSATIWPVTIATPGRPNTLVHIVPTTAAEGMSIAPYVRISSTPSGGTHSISLQSIDVDVALKHHHPL